MGPSGKKGSETTNNNGGGNEKIYIFQVTYGGYVGKGLFQDFITAAITLARGTASENWP